MCLLYPIAYPISKALDVLLNDEDHDGTSFSRHELSAMVRIQYEEQLAAKKKRRESKLNSAKEANVTLNESSHLLLNLAACDHSSALPVAKQASTLAHSSLNGSGDGSLERGTITRKSLDRMESLHFDEVTMLEGALKMKTKLAMDIYTPLRRVFAVPYDLILTESRIVEIYSSGYSRVPVFRKRPDKVNDKSDIVGILLTKQLIVVNTHDKRPIRTLPLLIPFCISPTMNLVDLINVFQGASTRSKGGHMAIVCARPLLAEQALGRGESIPQQAGVMGIVTLEDCIEELLQEQIYDETDRPEVRRAKIALRAWRKWRLFVKKGKTKREEATIARMHHPLLLNIVEAAIAVNSADAHESTPLVDIDSRPKRFFGLFS
jgi:metal transporter CNNM